MYPDIQWRQQWVCFRKCWNCSSILRYNFQVGPSHQNNQTARWSWIGYQWCCSLIHNNYTWHLGSGVTGHDHETQRPSQLQLLHIWVIVEWYLSQCHLGYPSPARPKVVNWWQWGCRCSRYWCSLPPRTLHSPGPPCCQLTSFCSLGWLSYGPPLHQWLTIIVPVFKIIPQKEVSDWYPMLWLLWLLVMM